jgi:PAS domain S-box-containing protein
MKYEDKTKEQLIDELVDKLQLISELEELQAKSVLNEEELKASEERMKILFDYAPDAYYLNNIKGNLVDGNKAAEEMIGYKKEELIGKSFSDLKILPTSQLPKAFKLLSKNALGFSTGPDEFTLTRKDGKNITTEIRTYPVKIKGKKLVLGIARDITERKKIEEALRTSEEKYRYVVERANDGIILIQKQKIVFSNKSFARMSGYSVAELEGLEFIRLVPKELHAMIADRVRRRLAGEDLPSIYELDLIRKNGNNFLVDVNAGIMEIKGEPTDLVILRDITERKKTQEKLFAIERRYHDLFDHLHSGVAVYEAVDNGKDFIFKDFNPAAEKIEHLQKENIIGKRVTEAFPGIKDFGLFDVLQRVWGTGKSEYLPENIYQDEKDPGSWRESWVYKMPTGEIVAIYNIITDRKNAELALKESEEKYRILVENAQEGIWSIDQESKTNFVNQRMAEILGYEVVEMLGKHLFSFMDEKGVELAKYNLERREKGIKEQHDFEFIRKDGNRVYASLETSPIMAADGKYLGALAMVADITDRKKMEEELKHSLEEKEMLLKEIHHRVKNNLMIISSLLNLQSSYIKDKTSKGIFKESQNRARSMALIHERLYQATDLKRIEFGDYIRTLAKELFRTYAGDFGLIELKINVEDIFLDINTAIPLGLIVNELITNSLKHAFPEGMKGEINVDFHPKDDHYEFTVKDNGIGLSQNLDFQNTDSLGLQIINNLTSQIDGEIELNRSLGTEFKITFKEYNQM